MRRHRSIRLLICAALVGSASLTAMAIPGGIAWANTPVTCTVLTGNGVTANLTRCTGVGVAQTGNRGTETVATKTIHWVTGKTSVLTYVSVAGNDATCPTRTGKTKITVDTAKGTVSGGTATGLVGAEFAATVCVYKLIASPHTISTYNKPGTTVKV